VTHCVRGVSVEHLEEHLNFVERLQAVDRLVVLVGLILLAGVGVVLAGLWLWRERWMMRGKL